MTRDAPRAVALKNEGNKYFQKGYFSGAESLYSQAIVADDSNPVLYTNRAMARLRLQLWPSAAEDCEACLKLSSENMKAHFFLAQAQIELHDPREALPHALKAHEICARTDDKSLESITALVRRCKKETWEERQRHAQRRGRELENETVSLFQREKEELIHTCDNETVRREVEEEWNVKINTLRETFEKAREPSERKREIPEWAIDDISFEVMVDPVVTKTGKSYERAAIEAHLRRSKTDPLTREPLSLKDLRPNLALREACEEFLEENGWAVDW